MFCSFDNGVGDDLSLEPHSLINPEHLLLSSGLSRTEKNRKKHDKLISDRIFFPLMGAVRTTTEIKFIDWWRICLSACVYPFSYRDSPTCRCFRSLCNQGWLVLACTLYRYRILVLAADLYLPARLWSLKTFLLWLSTPFLVGELACCWVRGLWLVQASLGHSCDEAVVLLAHTGTRTWQHHAHNQGCSSRLSVCPSVHHLCKLDLMNVGELRWKTTPSCWCPLWLGLFIEFILDRWRFNPLDCL